MKIIQLTDFHLLSNPGETLYGHCTYDCLKTVIDSIKESNIINSDAIFVTGDVSQDGSTESYHLALAQLERMKLPIYFIAGNHDNKMRMESVLKKSKLVYNIDELKYKDWKFVSVNTVQHGKDSGLLLKDEIINIKHEIIKNKNMKFALFMHHHPIPVGTPLVDECMLMNGKDILNICDAYDEIKSIACGHAHTDYTEKYNNCIIDVCPATCFQWKHGTENIQTENKRGFKLLDFSVTYQSISYLI